MHRRPHARNKSGYLSQETIAALATAPGGPIAIIRVSGSEAFAILDRLAPGIAGPRRREPRRLSRARLVDLEGRPLDDALVAIFPGPDSFTGEDVVELHVHGGAYLTSRLLEVLSAAGACQALPGEFSFRAVRHGKLGLAEAEAVSDLIAATNSGAAELALEKMSGAQSRFIAELATGLRELVVLAEAGIDFSDQDLEEVSLPSLRRRMESILATLRGLHGSFARGSRLQEGVRVAFAGLPNAGKSTFFNRLLGEDRSIVSEIPGTTRDVIRERITLAGRETSVTLRLEDTAGLRGSVDPIERIGIARTRQAVAAADLVLFLVDASEDSEGARRQWGELSTPESKLETRTIGILAKSDLVSASQLALRLSELRPLGIPTWTETSALSGNGIEEAIAAITSFCERWVFREKGEILLTRLDHLNAVAAALEHLERAKSAEQIDLFASDLKQALHALGPLIGETLPDDILGRIFSDFCIGK